MRIRQIKKYGNTFAIKLSPSDLEDLDLKINEWVDISGINKVEKELE